MDVHGLFTCKYSGIRQNDIRNFRACRTSFQWLGIGYVSFQKNYGDVRFVYQKNPNPFAIVPVYSGIPCHVYVMQQYKYCRINRKLPSLSLTLSLVGRRYYYHRLHVPYYHCNAKVQHDCSHTPPEFNCGYYK
jgi:hypothetical protein